jgi:hypothetical protein
MSGDPLRVLWDALEAHGCRPHGLEYDFRACCPGHGGDNPSALKVAVGADGRALLWCFAHQCDVEAITAALGLQVADLFPDGHYRGRRHPLRPVRRSDFDGIALTVANVLHALEGLGVDWRLMIASDCPYCGGPAAWLRASRDHVDADCPGGCDSHNYVQGLLASLAKQQKEKKA